MSTETCKSIGLNNDWLQRYVKMRHKIDIEANSIYSISSMLALIDRCGDDKIDVDPVALGKINQTINNNILNIWEILDDFIYIVQAKSDLDKLNS